DTGRAFSAVPLLFASALESHPVVSPNPRPGRLPDEARREPHQDLVLNECVAELHQHLPSRAALTEVLRSVGRRIEVEPRMTPDERDHLVHPWPAAETADDRQLGEVDRHPIEVAWMAEVVRAVGRVVHGGVDAHGDVQLDGLRVERIVAPIAGRDAVHEGRDSERVELLLAYPLLQLADAAHASKRA